jgi:hypothetical protein
LGGRLHDVGLDCSYIPAADQPGLDHDSRVCA